MTSQKKTCTSCYLKVEKLEELNDSRVRTLKSMIVPKRPMLPNRSEKDCVDFRGEERKDDRGEDGNQRGN